MVAWAEHGLDWTVWIIRAIGTGRGRPYGGCLSFPPTDGPAAFQPLLFSSSDGEWFADAVPAALLFASVGLRDCYLARRRLEVHLAHHHDKVVVLMPDAVARQALVQDMTDAAWLFEDVSGYGSEADSNTY